MPSVSKKQARLMAAVAHSPTFAKRVGIPQSVGKEFNEADAGTGILKGKRPKRTPARIAKYRVGKRAARNALGMT